MAAAGVNSFLNAKEHLARRRRDAETEKQKKELLILNLCASASLREISYSLTPSPAMGETALQLTPRAPLGAKEIAAEGQSTSISGCSSAISR
jgi:hypothetical protein